MVGQPLPDYSELMNRLATWLPRLQQAGFDFGHGRVAHATAEQLTKLSTSLVRGDRFSEGTLAWAFESGLLLAIVRRAAALALQHDDGV